MLDSITVSDWIQFALLTVVCCQLWFAYKVFKATHERQKKQATFEFVNAVSDRYKNALEKFNSKHGHGRIVDIGDYDEEDKQLALAYLNEIERICAGVNSDVFDFDILRKMMSTVLQRRHHRFSQYIDKMKSKTPTAYQEYGEVVRKLKEADRTT